jgi:hypothetical protein
MTFQNYYYFANECKISSNNMLEMRLDTHSSLFEKKLPFSQKVEKNT